MASNKGFSLLELLIIIAIIAVIAAVGVPSLLPLKGHAQLQESWSKLTDQLALYRARAGSTGATYTACSIVGGTSVTVQAGVGAPECGCLGNATNDPGETLELERVFLEVCGGIGTGCVVVGNGIPLTCFRPDGSSPGGTFRLRSRSSNCANPADTDCHGEYVVQIHQSTGFFDLYELSRRGATQGQYVEIR